MDLVEPRGREGQRHRAGEVLNGTDFIENLSQPATLVSATVSQAKALTYHKEYTMLLQQTQSHDVMPLGQAAIDYMPCTLPQKTDEGNTPTRYRSFASSS